MSSFPGRFGAIPMCVMTALPDSTNNKILQGLFPPINSVSISSNQIQSSSLSTRFSISNRKMGFEIIQWGCSLNTVLGNCMNSLCHLSKHRVLPRFELPNWVSRREKDPKKVHGWVSHGILELALEKPSMGINWDNLRNANVRFLNVGSKLARDFNARFSSALLTNKNKYIVLMNDVLPNNSRLVAIECITLIVFASVMLTSLQ